MSTARHRYRGHRADSFHPIDVSELTELRARQRTFNGAYGRTALVNLGYALTVLKLFDRRFYKIGLLYTLLSALLFITAFLRTRHSRHDFADYDKEILLKSPIATVGQQGKRVYGRPFVTAGWIVLTLTGVVCAVEIGLFVLVLKVS